MNPPRLCIFLMKRFYDWYIESFRGMPKRAWYLAMAQLISSSGTMVIFFVTLYLSKKLNYSLAQAGQVMSVFGFGMVFGTVTGGNFADALGTHITQRLSLFSTGIVLLIMGQTVTFSALLPLAALWGFSFGLFFPANSSAMAAECPGKLRPRGFALIRLINNLGATVAPIVGGFLAHYNYTYLFMVDGVSCLVAAAVLWILFPENGRPNPVSTPSKALEQAEKAKVGIKKSKTKGQKVLKFLASKKELLILLLSTVALTTIVAQIFSTWAPFLREKEHLNESQIGLLLSISTIVIVFFQMPLIHSLHLRSQTLVAAWGAIFYAVGFGLLIIGQGVWLQILSVVIWTIGEMLAFPSLMNMVSQLASPGKQGKYQGLYSLTFSLGMAIGPSVGTWIAGLYHWNILWIVTSSLGLLAAINLLFVDTKKIEYRHS